MTRILQLVPLVLSFRYDKKDGESHDALLERLTALVPLWFSIVGEMDPFYTSSLAPSYVRQLILTFLLQFLNLGQLLPSLSVRF